MTLKSATLVAIIGTIISAIGAMIMTLGSFNFDNVMTLKMIWALISLLENGSMLLFLFTLYTKQK